MKSLKLFIEDSISIPENCQEVYNLAQLFFFQEKANYKLNILDNLSIFEGDSVFDGCYEMSLVVAKVIDKNFHKIQTNAKLIVTDEMLLSRNIKNVYFNKATIIVHKDKQSKKNIDASAEFDTLVSHNFWDPINKMFKEIQIKITIPYDFYEQLQGEDTPSSLDLIMHEFRHGFQDIGLHERGKSLLEINDKLENIIKDVKLKDFEKEIIRNIAAKNECESYIAQIDGEIKGRTFKDIKSATLWLNKYCNVWKQYIKLKEIVDKKCSKKTQIIFYKGWNKFINHVGHLLNKHTDKQNLTLENYHNFSSIIKKSIDIDNLIEELEKELDYETY